MKKIRIILAAMLAALLLGTGGTATAAGMDDEEALRRMTAEYREHAINRTLVEFYGRHAADGFMGVFGSAWADKPRKDLTEFLTDFPEGEPKLLSATLGNIHIRLAGDAATVYFDELSDYPVTENGGGGPVAICVSWFMVRQGGRWKLLMEAASEIKKPGE